MEKDKNESPLTVGILKELLKEQTKESTKNLRDIENNLKLEIAKSEKHVKEHVEKQLLEVKGDVHCLKESVKKNTEEIRYMKIENDRRKRLRNLVLFKIPEDEINGLELKQKVKTILLDSCKVDITNNIDRIYRIGKAGQDKIRPILIALTSLDKKKEIMWGKAQHKSSIELSEDFSPEVLEERRKLVPVMKTLRSLNYENVHINQDKLVVAGVVCDEAAWKDLIKSRKSVGAEDVTVASVNGNKRKNSVSPKGNNSKKLNLPQNELHPSRPDISRDYLQYNKRPPCSPISKFLSQKAVAEIKTAPENSSDTLNQTFK